MSLSLAENVIVARADNRLLMLDKTNYSSWASRMLLYIKGKEHGKLLVDSVLNRPFQYGTMKKMLLTEALESGVYLDPAQLAFLADNGDTVTPILASQGIPFPTAFQTNDFDAFDSDCDDGPSAKAVLIDNIFSYDSDVLFDVPFHEINIVNYMSSQKTKTPIVQRTSSSTQQDELLMSVIKEMSSQVAKCNTVQQENKVVIVYKNAKVADFQKQIHSLKLQLNATVKSHKTLSTTIECLKKKSKQNDDDYLNEVIDLPKKNKSLDTMVYKMGQSTQTMHMLTKPQAFYDESHKTTLGYQNPFYLSQARQKVPALYDRHTIIKTHDALSVKDTEKTLELAEESRLKMLAKQNDPSLKYFNAFWLPISQPVSENPPVPSRPVLKKEIHRELPSISLVIEFGDSYEAPENNPSTTTTSTTSGEKSGRTITLTTKDMQKKKKNDVKARTTLLLSLPDEYQLRFSVEVKQDDLNQKFLTSLAPEWLMHTIVWRNRSDLDTMSLDDLYNHLKVYEEEVQKKSEPNAQNMAFISSTKHNRGNDEVNTATVYTATVYTASSNAPNASANVATDINQINEDDMEEIDIKWNMALLSMRADKFWKKTEKKISIQRSDVARQGSKAEEQTPKALMAIDGVGWDWSYMANNEEDHALVAEAPTEFALMANTSTKNKQEKEVVDGKLAGLLSASKDLDNLIENQRPSPAVESSSKEDQNRNPSASKNVASPITPKQFVKFVKASDSQSKSKTDEKETPEKPPVKDA
nr:hypothetical protein [Tanacetum cinerariifolium]